MPELSDDMYCSQQIMVPPMFPYILRQYAKAAIRSQPTDLLRWSTAYFRCLSLNLPPPVKPRLEYPLPKDYDGITPGWLKALLYQLANNTHIDFKVLWDRWIGACQNHLTLIKILCLGGFSDPLAIPLLRFIGLCVGFLSENLTQTMILFCEVVTEEPEGGSAMISVETFIDIYTFLANIDASKGQVLLNQYFPDELLALLEKKEQQKEKVDVEDEKKEQVEKEVSSVSEIVEEEDKVEEVKLDILSCPDLIDELAAQASSEDSDILDQGSKSTLVDDKERVATARATSHDEDKIETIKKHEVRIHSAQMGEGGEEFEGYSEILGEEPISDASALIQTLAKDNAMKDEKITEIDEESETAAITEDPVAENEQDQEDQPSVSSVFASTEVHQDKRVSLPPETPSMSTSVNVSTTLSEKIDKREDGDVVEPEEGPEFDKYLQSQSDIIDEMSAASQTSEMRTEVVKAPAEQLGEYSIAEPEVGEEQELVVEGKFTVDEIFVEAIPGIGPVVPSDLVEVVVEYMKACAAEQQGMVMPRNIRHYSCPPLEVYV